VTDWYGTCLEAVQDVKRVLRELPSREERERVLGFGEGGDETTAIDAAAEQAVIARFEATGEDFTLVSEEVGIRPARGDSKTHIVIDPIDGSINAKRGIPFFSLSIAVADGPTMGDVQLGFVWDFGAGEEWWAQRLDMACVNDYNPPDDRPLRPRKPERLELLSLEATRTDLVAQQAPALVGVAHRVRVMGSLAISLCHLAAGRVDAVCSLKPARSVDIAAAQLLVREVGFVIGLPDGDVPFEKAPLDLIGRSRVVAAGTEEHYGQIVAAIR
jgi:myo-inositol-1(or 4)-monophosphatase